MKKTILAIASTMTLISAPTMAEEMPTFGEFDGFISVANADMVRGVDVSDTSPVFEAGVGYTFGKSVKLTSSIKNFDIDIMGRSMVNSELETTLKRTTFIQGICVNYGVRNHTFFGSSYADMLNYNEIGLRFDTRNYYLNTSWSRKPYGMTENVSSVGLGYKRDLTVGKLDLSAYAVRGNDDMIEHEYVELNYNVEIMPQVVLDATVVKTFSDNPTTDGTTTVASLRYNF